METYRQGDVILIRVDDGKVRVGARIPRENGRVVLAHGELTGHAHAISSRYASLRQHADQDESARAEALGTRVLTASQPVNLQHEEHAPIRVPPGTYLVRIQREYAPEALRNVAD